jgi:hypothetical protein
MAKVYFRNFWGNQKLTELNASLDTAFSETGNQVVPEQKEFGLPYVPLNMDPNYASGVSIENLFFDNFSGIQTKRDGFLIDIEQDKLEARIEDLFDVQIPDEDLSEAYPDALKDLNKRSAKKARKYFQVRGIQKENFLKICYKPFDFRHIYWEPDHGYLGTPSGKFVEAVKKIPNNFYFEARQKENREEFTRGLVTNCLADNMGNGFSNYFPRFTISKTGDIVSNINQSNLPQGWPLKDDETFFYIVATLHSPRFLSRNRDMLTRAWPRIPVEIDIGHLQAMSNLGASLVRLYVDFQNPAFGPDISKQLAVPKIADHEKLHVDASWGTKSNSGIMPGKGLPVSSKRETEIVVISPISNEKILVDIEVFDLSINDTLVIEAIPVIAWEKIISGYQVLKKWLSYRSFAVVRRNLSADEILYFCDAARRLTLIELLPTISEGKKLE